MDGDGFVHGLTCKVECGVPSIGGGARFFGKGEGDGGVCENETGFGHTDAFDGLETSGGEGQGTVSGKADVFGGKNDHTSGDKLRIFASFNHPRKVVKSGVDVRATQRFNKGGNGIVMVIAFFVVAGDFSAGGFDNDVFGNIVTYR